MVVLFVSWPNNSCPLNKNEKFLSHIILPVKLVNGRAKRDSFVQRLVSYERLTHSLRPWLVRGDTLNSSQCRWPPPSIPDFLAENSLQNRGCTYLSYRVTDCPFHSQISLCSRIRQEITSSPCNPQIMAESRTVVIVEGGKFWTLYFFWILGQREIRG